MIELATTPVPAAMPGGQASSGGTSRDAGRGFADLVAQPGSGKAATGAPGEVGNEPGDQEDTQAPAGRRQTTAQGDADRQPDAETAPAWPARGLHKVLASLLGERDARAGTGEEPPADASLDASGETLASANDALTLDEEDEAVAEPGSETGEDADDARTEDAAAMPAMAGAIILPAQTRDQRPLGASATRGAEQPVQSAAPAATPQEETAGRDGEPSGDDRRGEMAADAGKRRSLSPETGEMKVRVITETVSPAPGLSQNHRTISDLAATIASDGGWKGAMERAAASRADAANAPAGPVRDLRIQLNPAELGSVDARLRIVGEQLSVEIRVESGEAFRRLSSEKDAILTALRGLGFAVDDVSIQQQTPASGSGQANAGSRQGDTSGGLSQGTGRDQQGEGRAASGHRRGEEQGGQNGDARTPATRPAGGDLYI